MEANLGNDELCVKSSTFLQADEVSLLLSSYDEIWNRIVPAN